MSKPTASVTLVAVTLMLHVVPTSAQLTLDPDDATQISNHLGGPDSALDGDHDVSSCTSDTAGQPWWMIDLGSVQDVGAVTIFVPTEGGDLLHGLDNFNIAGMSAKYHAGTTIAAPGDYAVTCKLNVQEVVNAGTPIDVECDDTIMTQFLLIQSDDNTAEHLCLAEVYVYGEVTTTPTMTTGPTTTVTTAPPTTTAAPVTTPEPVTSPLDEGNLAMEPDATVDQTSTYVSSAVSAVDGDPTAASCTEAEGQTWWAVDLGQPYTIERIVILSPDVTGENLNGLDNFQVGFPSTMPVFGDVVDIDSYPLCFEIVNQRVEAGFIYDEECPETDEQYQYVIVQSTDTTGERLCLAEVGVYEPEPPTTTTAPVTTTVTVTEGPTTTPTPPEGCLSYAQSATQINGDELPATEALDASLNTYSCTATRRGNSWWVVDLGQEYEIGSVVITLPNVAGEELNGLDNFQVVFPTSIPAQDTAVEVNAYTKCGTKEVSVAVGLEITVTCEHDTSVLYQYVMIQSLDNEAELLCMAEVCVYEPVPMSTTTTAPATTTREPADCLSNDQNTIQISTWDDDTISTLRGPSSFAVDRGRYDTWSCTLNNEGIPWWAVDLGAEYIIKEVVLTLPNVRGDDLNGLNKFQIGYLTALPAEGERVEVESYELCGSWDDVVSVALEITVTCTPTTTPYQYIIVQSLDNEAEQLCAADICILEGPVPTTTPPITTAGPTTTGPPGDCLSSNKPASQLDDEVDGEADLAVDDDTETFSCTLDNEAYPWWVVNLGAPYSILSVNVTLPPINGDNLNGLDNFQIVFPPSMPPAGTTLATDAFSDVCGTSNIGVSIGQVITVECAATTNQYQYVLIQSLDRRAEKLCIAEVCVYEGTAEVDTTTVGVTTPAEPADTTVDPGDTTAPPADACLSSNRDTVQISDEADGGLAVDGNAMTYSCTQDVRSHPWWVVDLGEESIVGTVTITLPHENGANLNGLDDFQVGFLTSLPTAGEDIDRTSYDVCGTMEVSVDVSLVLDVSCTATTTLYQYVIIQSLDMLAEKLCLAEVCILSEAVSTAAPTAAPTECLSSDKPTIQITDELDGGFAVDGNDLTYSCTQDIRSHPWWVVDLEEEYTIGTVTITLPHENGANLNGLDNFQVGFLTTAPVAGTEVDRETYDICGVVAVSVDISLKIVVTCEATTAQYQYIIIQSLDINAEKLCIAEVCIVSEGAATTPAVTEAPTTEEAVPTTMPPVDTTAAPSALCLSSGKDTVQITDLLDGGFAVDDNTDTYSCTQNVRSHPWWAVDLEAEYTIGSVEITLPSRGGDALNGLNNFQVGFLTAMPTSGTDIDVASYDVCGAVVVSVDVGLKVEIPCDAAVAANLYQYVIIQSLDTDAEFLCIAEACISSEAPTTAPPTAAPGVCLSSNKDTLQITTGLDGGLAVDGDANTHSCTRDVRSNPWWFVDLGQEYNVRSVTITLPSEGGRTLNGLNNFQVGFPTVLPTEGTLVDTSSYELCGSVVLPVDVGLVIDITCASNGPYQYVIVQSADTNAEILCIAEVCVNEGLAETEAPTTAAPATAAPTTVPPDDTTAAPSDCVTTGKDAVQITTLLRLDSSLAVDNNVNTHSCTMNSEAFPWWAADLGQPYSISSVVVTLPNEGGNTLNGLDNFRVGFLTVLPSAGETLDRNSYTVCGDITVGVTIGEEITVSCAASSEAQYIVVQSLDTRAEELCIAEVCAYEGVVTTAPPTAAPTDCLSTFKNAVEMTQELAATLAVDGFYHTHSCTNPDESHPWWAVDLGDAYLIDSVTIYLPAVNHDNLNGLNNFRVGFPDTLPTAGSAVGIESYPVCGDVEVGVSVGLVLTVACSCPNELYPYVIIQSLDTNAEKLCIAEVCVNECDGVPTTVPPTAAPTTEPQPTIPPSECLSLGKTSVEMTLELPASLANDGDVDTYSCTQSDVAFPWWAVDLGQVYEIGSVEITYPSASGADLNGLNYFQVGFPDELPSAASPVEIGSYPICGVVDVGVSGGLVINVDCTETGLYQYVIVQSIDTSAEKLCIAEVCAYEAEAPVPTLQPGNLALNKGTVAQITTVITASNGNDGDGTSYSCTDDDEAFPWWAVDLEQEYYIGSIIVNLPIVGGEILNGLNNFQVGFPSTMPTAGSAVATSSYPVCQMINEGVTEGKSITIECPASTEQYRYVIVQSLDTSAEQLCIGEVGVYEGAAATTTTTAAPTTGVVSTTTTSAGTAVTTQTTTTTAETATPSVTTAAAPTTETTTTVPVETTTEERPIISTPTAIVLITLAALYGTVLGAACLCFFVPQLIRPPRVPTLPTLPPRPRRIPAYPRPSRPRFNAVTRYDPRGPRAYGRARGPPTYPPPARRRPL